ncbi:MAG: zinc-ribbon domain-containing protein [Promethearchaeota archaeon]
MKHKTGVILIIIGGIFMVLSFAVGSLGIFEFIYELAASQWPEYEPIFNIVINVIFKWIADLGGFAVIAGGVLIALGALKLGKFIVYLGLAFGTFALIVWAVSQVVNLTGITLPVEIQTWLDTLVANYSYGTGLEFIGVVLAIIGRKAAIRRKPKVEEEKKEEEGVEEEVSKPLEKKHCPECGTELPVFANFCSNCGKTFD